jgi:hypothetical protein
VARKERNFYGPSIVHDGGVPHGSNDDLVIRALVLSRPPGKARLPRGRCEPHDLSKHVVLLSKYVCSIVAYRCVGALGTSRPVGSCHGSA